MFRVLYEHLQGSAVITTEQEEEKENKNNRKGNGGTERWRDSPQSHSSQPLSQNLPYAPVSRYRADGGCHRSSSPICPQLRGLKRHLPLGAAHPADSIPGILPLMDMAGELCGSEIKVHFEGQVEKGRPLGGGSGNPKVDSQGEMPSSLLPRHLRHGTNRTQTVELLSLRPRMGVHRL